MTFKNLEFYIKIRSSWLKVMFAPNHWHQTVVCYQSTRVRYPNKKLIRRWDSEREVSLRWHCTRTKNTIDSCINSATNRFLQRKFTKFSEITQCNGQYAVQGHSKSPVLVPIERSYTISYQWLIVTYLLSCTVPSYGWLLFKFSLTRAECLTLSLSLGVTPANIAINDMSLKTRFCGLHFHCSRYRCIFNHFYVIRPEKLPNSVKLHGGKGYYAVQGHPRSPSLVPIESPYATSY